MPNAPAPRLSKSKFIAGLQCPKLLWWQVHEPDAPELEPDPAQQFLFDRGHEVGRVAQTYVPGGVLIDVPHRERERRLRETAAALGGGARVLYEAAFEHDGVLVVADILERVRGGWGLIEVKSSTRLKPEHLPDVAIQTHVLRGAGLVVRRAELMHLNRECRHPDLSNLFEREDVTAVVEELLGKVPGQVRALVRALQGPLPQVEIGDHCHEPYDCPFLERCWPEPPPHALQTLYRMGRDQREAYETEGYRTILDLPDDETLSAIQERQRRAARSNRLVVEAGLADALEELHPPFAYLDFETVAPPIPVWNGCRPYDQVPVQLSVHRVAAGGRLTHQAWLAEGPGDPRQAIARRLIEFTAGARTILAYNAPFERRRIQELAERLPRLAARLQAVESRLRDLHPVVRDHVYHPRFNGSFGLKSVAPALAPGISYDGLEVAGGGEASQMLYDLLLRGDGLKEAQKRRMRRELLRYCRMDTEALVGVHRALVELAQGHPAVPGHLLG
jgi:predicted RecB family nuclease